MSSTLIQSLRKGLSPAYRRVLDEIADDPVVTTIIEKAEASALVDRKAKVDELAALPGRHLKAIKAAGAAYATAIAEERGAEEALTAARARRCLAGQVSHGLEHHAEVEAENLRRELREGASPLLHAAFRAVNAASISQYLPEELWTFVPRLDVWDPRDYRDAVAAADAVVVDRHRTIAAAEVAQRVALVTLEALMLEALGEADVAERVTSVFRALNAAFDGLKHSPHFVVSEFGDVELRFGPGEVALTVKPADVGAGKKQ